MFSYQLIPREKSSLISHLLRGRRQTDRQTRRQMITTTQVRGGGEFYVGQSRAAAIEEFESSESRVDCRVIRPNCKQLKSMAADFLHTQLILIELIRCKAAGERHEQTLTNLFCNNWREVLQFRLI